MKEIFFTPGPSELYYTVGDHIRTALRDSIPSISHRSSAFKSIYAEAATNLRELLSIPSNFEIIFLSSATETWERLLQNLVEEHSLHLVNGAFSKRFYQVGLELGKKSISIQANHGECVNPDEITTDHTPELIAITHNETSTGASQPLEDIKTIRKKFPDALIAVDAVSSMPYPEFDYNQFNSIYFSVQKCFGLPAGLGVWIIDEKSIKRNEELEKKGLITGSYHRLSALAEKAKGNQTPETPNVLNIYLLAQVTKDMLRVGVEQLRRETNYKAALLYHTIAEHPKLEAFVKNDVFKSKTTIVAHSGDHTEKIISTLKTKNLIVGSGYGEYKQKHIRIANFPTHSKEQVEHLCDEINKI